MSPFPSILRAVAALGLSIIAAMASVSAPSASFTASTPNPAAHSLVLFTDTSSGSPTRWSWDFGDGGTSTEQNSSHVYTSPGSFTVHLTATNASGPSSATMNVTVTAETVLRLNAAHTFDLTLTARDPRTGNSGLGKVIGQNDVYGYFSIPDLSGNAGNPEIIVKMVDATGIGQSYWVFYGCMTDLEYTLSVKENATSVVKTYAKDVAKPCGQFDTSGFLPTATPAQTPIATPTPVPTPPAGPGPTPPGPQIVALTASQFQWDFNGGGSSFTAHVGTTYELQIRDIDPPGTNAHGFSGISGLGISGASLSPGGAARIVRFTPTSNQVGPHLFACSVSSCGIGHNGMLATIMVAP
jgi:PKD repeat protein